MNHESYMRRCIELALNGMGNVSPNPMVGAVLVHNDKIIGEGYHQKYGEAHAEVNAIESVKDRSLLEDATLYVSLEPCNHFGKTPPCSDLIVKNKIPRVVIGCVDPFDQVAGKGIEKLEDNGIDVTLNVLQDECVHLNRRFFTFHNKKRPYVILKWAETQDGFMDKLRDEDEEGINWITQPETKTITHQWRAKEDAILVGKNTVLNDNPSLTVRAASGKHPIRIVLDTHLELPSNKQIFDDQSPTLIFNTKKDEQNVTNQFIKVNNTRNINEVLNMLYTKNIQSVIIEGGQHVLHAFINQNSWDEARVLKGKSYFSEGIKAPTISSGLIEDQYNHGVDQITIYRNV